MVGEDISTCEYSLEYLQLSCIIWLQYYKQKIWMWILKNKTNIKHNPDPARLRALLAANPVPLLQAICNHIYLRSGGLLASSVVVVDSNSQICFRDIILARLNKPANSLQLCIKKSTRGKSKEWIYVTCQSFRLAPRWYFQDIYSTVSQCKMLVKNCSVLYSLNLEVFLYNEKSWIWFHHN